MTKGAISISQLVLNEVARAPAIPAPGLYHFWFPLFRSFRNALAHRALPSHMPCEDKGVRLAKAYKGVGMEGCLATWYARQTLNDSEEFERTAHRIAPYLPAGARVLEIAPGPGYLAIALAKLTGCRMQGLDISRSFVRIATDNARKADVDADFQHGDAADLPFPAEQFDFIVCRAAFKNFARPLQALDEMHRVLKPGGIALVIDLRKDFSAQALNDYVRGRGVISAAVTKLTFHAMLKKRAYTKDAIADLVARSRFGRGDIRLEPIGFELWLHK